ncbi:MAG: strictosidine synthase family protein [bacterium]
MKVFIGLFAGIVLIAGWFVLDIYRDTGEFKTIVPHFDGHIDKVAGVVGAEDITVLPESGIAFISSDDRRRTLAGQPGKGAIYAYDLTSETPVPVNLTDSLDLDFHPHGISLLEQEGGGKRLLVVNHAKEGPAIEIFALENNKLRHLESVRGELMHSPNDVVAVGPNQFYVTNDHGNRSEMGRTLEEYLRLPRANVLYYDGGAFRVAATGLLYANGINKSHDGRSIYVAATTEQKVHVYNRDLHTGHLEHLKEIEVGTGVDNIEVDPAGNLWLGAHPKLLTFVDHAKDASNLAPSQVIKITLHEHGDYEAEEVFLDTGEALSASSVAAVFKDKLLIGAVFDAGFLVCTLPQKM